MSKLKIGIDAKWYFTGPPSSIIVVKNLVNAVVDLHDPDIDWYIFVNKNDEHLIKGSPLDTHVHIVPVSAKINVLSNIFILPYKAQQLKLDLVLFQNYTTFNVGSFKRVAYIHDVLFLDYPQFFTKIENIYFRSISYLAKKAFHIITISQSEKKRLQSHHIAAADQVSVIYHGISDLFKPKSSYQRDEIQLFKERYQLPEAYLLYLGRLNVRKNILNLVKAFSKVNDQTLKLVIVGKREEGSPVYNELMECIAANGLSERVIITGSVPDKDLYLMYALSHIFCFPSYAEGFGLPPLEAMKCGIPVIVSNTTALPEACGDAGLYINPDQPDEITQHINNLMADKGLYNEMCSRSLAQSAKFTWARAAAELLYTLKRMTAL